METNVFFQDQQYQWSSTDWGSFPWSWHHWKLTLSNSKLQPCILRVCSSRGSLGSFTWTWSPWQTPCDCTVITADWSRSAPVGAASSCEGVPGLATSMLQSLGFSASAKAPSLSISQWSLKGSRVGPAPFYGRRSSIGQSGRSVLPPSKDKWALWPVTPQFVLCDICT